ncbi:MAG: ferritin-like domain-containing protein [Actinomycetota bacterium]|nr:ferritin-like domain-containing protein [Actinomycetota bacterium]
MRGFDLSRYLRASRKLDLGGIDFDRVPDYPLTRAEVRCLTYMMDVESHTVIYLRDLLGTRAAYDPEITAFLSLWVYEEFWHGEALAQFLRAAGQRFTADRTYAIRAAADGGGTMVRAAKRLASRFEPNFVAVHMTWGAVNELSTLSGYQQVVAGTRHPVLVELLTRIIKDERRHYAFYYNQSRQRLDGSARGQRLVKWALTNFWTPVGSGVRPQEETDFVIGHLFGGDAGDSAVRAMENELSKLPGLGGMRIMTRARNRALRRSPVAMHPRFTHVAASIG